MRQQEIPQWLQAFIDLFREGELIKAYLGLYKARAMSVEELRKLWDSYDGIETSDLDIFGETVHFVLNEKGDGEYCAI